MSNEIIIAENSDLGFSVEPSENPAMVYLSGLGSKGSQRTMRAALKSIISVVWNKSATDADVFMYPWWNLEHSHTQALRAKLVQMGYAASTINRMMSALRGVLKECWRLKLMDVDDSNRAADIKNVKGSKLPAGRYIPKEEIRAMLGVCYADTNKVLGLRDAALIALLYLTGPRRAEVANLKMEDLNLDTGALRILGKGNKEREIYIVEDCLDKLLQWFAVRGFGMGYLFNHIERGGNIVDAGIGGNAIAEIIADRSKAAGIPKTTPHDFRRSAISNLLDKGVDPITITYITGHSSVNMVKLYDRRKEQPKIDALKLLTLE